ncbi:unnamed protein product, partial [Ectocarpus sp. 8 AP-2014]
PHSSGRREAYLHRLRGRARRLPSPRLRYTKGNSFVWWEAIRRSNEPSAQVKSSQE